MEDNDEKSQRTTKAKGPQAMQNMDNKEGLAWSRASGDISLYA
jgi:hypothetical protein